jgi:hypothetical protein
MGKFLESRAERGSGRCPTSEGPNYMLRKRLLRIAAIVFTIGMVAGCGDAALVAGPATVPASPNPVTSSTQDPTDSASYCQQRPGDGKWVTNQADSDTPCVPDPAYATGNEAVDASKALPRCFNCTFSDWVRAEQRAADRLGSSSVASGVITTGNDATSAKWSATARGGFISACTEGMTGSLCDCLANHLDWQVPSAQAQALTGQDPRVQAAVQDCRT